MRTCPHCNHVFDSANEKAAQCPACGRQMTVSDVGAATMEFDVPPAPAPSKPPTVNDIGGATMEFAAPAPPSPDPSPSAAPGKPPTVTDIGGATMEFAPPADSAPSAGSIHATIQAGKWTPSPDEIADAAAGEGGPSDAPAGASSLMHTMDLGRQSAMTPPSLRDLTIIWGTVDSIGGSGADFAVSGSNSAKSGSAPLSAGSARAPSNQAPAQSGGSGRPKSSAAGSAQGSQGLGSAPHVSLEQSLVIQPRVLREEAPATVENAPDQPTERVDFSLLKKLGEGGMGVVYAARQSSIRRTVALKMLKSSGSQSSSQREKFLSEAVITGELEHPNIVPIYDLGRDEAGAIFYAMKHVKGTPWDKLIETKSVAENIEILLKVADGVAFAHSRGVIHRDLKPENIMLGDFGEVLVMDWGLAISIDNPPPNFSMGGTPAYMAPEMAIGPVHKIGIQSDVYLLGAVLFEIVTGQRPHVGPTTTRCLMSAAKNEICPTQKTGELIDIALRAMATQTEDRYPRVLDFQAAIRDYQSHTESIALGARAQADLEEARRNDDYDNYARALFGFQEAISLWDGNARAKTGAIEAAEAYAESALRKGDYDLGLSLLDKQDVRHERLIAALSRAQGERESRQRRLKTARRIGVGLTAAILFVVTGAFFWIRAEAARARAAEVVAKDERAEAVKQRKTAEEERARAVTAREEEERQRKFAEEQQAKAIAARQEEERQRLAADAAREKEEYEAYVARLGLAAAKIDENSFDHAEELLQECPPRLRHWEWGRLAFLCRRDVRSYDCGRPLEALAVSADGKRFAAGGWGGEVRIVEIATGDTLTEFATGGEYVFALAFSPDGTQLAVGGDTKPEFITLWNTADGKRSGGLQGHRDSVLSVVYSRDGKKLLSGSYDNTARLFDLTTGSSKEFRGHDWWVWSAAFSPDEKRIVTAGQEGSAIVWSVDTAQPGPPFLGHGGPLFSAAFSPDGKFVATAGYDKRVLLWRPEDIRVLALDQVLAERNSDAPQTPFVALEGHTAGVRSVCFSTDGRLLLSAGNDNVIGVWDLENKQLVKKLRGHAGRVSAAVFAAGDDRVLSVAHDHRARLWSISKYEELRVLGGRVLNGHKDAILGAAFSPDGGTVVTAGRDRSAVAWDVTTGKQLRSYNEGHAYLASAALFLPDGKHVLTAAVDNTTRVWDITSGTQSAVLEGTGPSAAVAVPADGAWIVTGSDDKALKIWTPAGKLLRRFGDLKSDVTALAVSPDAQFILVGDAIGRCRLIKADTGEEVWEAKSHSRGITAAAFLPDGRRILTASLDKSVAQWDTATGKEDPSRLLKHSDAVTSLALSGDGRRVLTACADKSVRLWDVEKAVILHTLPAGDAAVSDVAVAVNGRRGITIGVDNRVRLWDLEAGRELPAPADPRRAFLDLSATTVLVWAAAFSDDGERILTVGGAEAHLWSAADAKPLVSFTPQSAVSSVQFSKNGEQLLTGSWDNAARIWSTATGAALVKLGGVHTRLVNAGVFSPDGTQVLTAGDDGAARLWDATAGTPLKSFLGHEGRVTDVVFSSDGKRVLTASDDKTARIWDSETGRTLWILRGHTQGLLCAKFSADDRLVITGSDDTTARLWDAKTGAALPITLAGHTAAVTAVAFTPDGRRALTGSKDITTKVWDPETGKEILTLTGHTQDITTVVVSPQGDRVLTGSRDGTAIIWLASPWTENAAAKPTVAAAAP